MRLLYEYGGIYLDTDMEAIASFDNLLKYSFLQVKKMMK
ncbi:glycosyltransferase [Klebsiella pneumoniae]|nr:glycosyltransferase [Klebsiella pneumoniae]